MSLCLRDIACMFIVFVFPRVCSTGRFSFECNLKISKLCHHQNKCEGSHVKFVIIKTFAILSKKQNKCVVARTLRSSTLSFLPWLFLDSARFQIHTRLFPIVPQPFPIAFCVKLRLFCVRWQPSGFQQEQWLCERENLMHRFRIGIRWRWLIDGERPTNKTRNCKISEVTQRRLDITYADV